MISGLFQAARAASIILKLLLPANFFASLPSSPQAYDGSPKPKGGTVAKPPPLHGAGTTADWPLTGAYYAEFMAGQLLAANCPRLWDTR